MVSRVALVSLVGLVCLTFLTFHVTMANRAGNSSTQKPAMTSETFSAEESKGGSVTMANHSGNSRKSTGGNVTVGNGAGNSITKMSDDTVANVAGNSVSGDSMFVCWLFCFLMFNIIPFYFEGFL